jgi:deoxyribodipyrimidine photo-lyase
MTKKSLYWFRQDLRLTDNPALIEAANNGALCAIYIHDTVNCGDYAKGEASRAWLDKSLAVLNQQLDNQLIILQGDPKEIIPALVKNENIALVTWNRCYTPWQIARDKAIKNQLKNMAIEVKTYSRSLLFEPWVATKTDGTPYQVFTPFYKACLKKVLDTVIFDTPKNISWLAINKKQLDMWQVNYHSSPHDHWQEGLLSHWAFGEEAAKNQLHQFLADDVEDYKEARDCPAKQGISKLSPYLHFGQLSPQQIVEASKHYPSTDGLESFLRQLFWREFSYSLLYYFPDFPKQPLRSKWQAFSWRQTSPHLQSWQQGKTGYPMVDAGMRELWQTGFMHNRVRMLTASFLTKNLMVDWRVGEAWFWDCLVDADLANNSAGWQWVAGCGADASPYFRIFNPVTQGKKFDAEANYIRQYLPELARLPDRYIHTPWKAPVDVLKEAGVILGESYPKPIVDLKVSREQALQAYQDFKG